MLLADLVATSKAVSSTRSRLEKIDLLAAILRRLEPAEAPIAVSYLSGEPMQSPLGVGHATVYSVGAEPAAAPSLEILDVDAVLEEVAGTSGPGSKARKEAFLADLLGKATPPEQEFLRGLVLRNLRQGALEGIMADAVAAALEVPAERVRRAAMLEGDLVGVASRALAEGAASLQRASLAVFTPVQPMLAKTAETAADAVATVGTAVVEWKLDGARVQVHREGERVVVFTRNLRDVTGALPEVVASALHLPGSSFILDGETLLMGPGGSPGVFQESMSRFGADDAGDRPDLAVFYFDCLHLDGSDLIDQSLIDRRLALAGLVPEENRVGSILTSDPDEAERFFDEVIARGFEGVVVKDPSQPYEAGRRGSGWLKVKPTHTLDLVILAAEWGSGRRQGWLSNLHLGARAEDGFVMLGKTFKGLTDEMLAWQTERFLEIEHHRQGQVVYLRPEIVYEIAFDGVQRSTRYPGGVALRFARVKRYRDDKGPGDADTLETVRSFLE
ncbi:MAG: ATP-dependent DNA ligase [Actinobacteria bacterium]|nr:ATP-dependent DNA ligase [Actinomycetota bacterium]